MQTDRLDWLEVSEVEDREDLSHGLDDNERSEWNYHWANVARPEQEPPEGDWRLWMILAGRGFGKTRAGAEWVRRIADSDPDARIALVAASLSEARSVMVEGESGILKCCPPWRAPTFEPSLRRLIWPNGAQAMLYSAGEPESLRGPQHSHAWCDEIGKWVFVGGQAMRTWDNLLLGLRVGEAPRILATTTPRSVPLVRRLLDEASADDVIVSAGYRKLIATSGVASGWVSETAARPETTTPKFAEIAPPSGELYANPAASQAMLDDAAFDLETWLANEIATEFARAEGRAFILGKATRCAR